MDIETMKALAELAAKNTIEQFESKMNTAIAAGISSAVALHSANCPTKISFDRIKWLLIGTFGSGVIGGGTVGAWLTSAVIKASPATTWMQAVVERILG